MQTFLEYYQKEIRPRLEAIDLFLKTQPQPYAPQSVAKLLRLTGRELRLLLEQKQLALITKGAFLYLMQEGSSPLCELYRRELSCGMPKEYSPAQIAYIYDLARGDVEAAAEQAGKLTYSTEELPSLFGSIFISDKQCRL